MGHGRLVNDDPKTEYPDFLRTCAQKSFSSADSVQHPVLFKIENKKDLATFSEFVRKTDVREVVDKYSEQYAELLLSRQAHLYSANTEVQISSIAKQLEEHYGNVPAWQKGSWVFLPWTKQLVHVLSEQNFEDLRTIRNRDLITKSEQAHLRDFSIASFGLSVGSAGALAMAITGTSKKLKLVDGAVISGSNLNRILTSVTSIGEPKAVAIGQQIYEMNPYSTLGFYHKADATNISSILDDSWTTNGVIDEIDDIEMKVRIRVEARKRRIPVFMATEIGDTIILDVERFDVDPTRDLFHGLVPGIDRLLDTQIENRREWMKHAVTIIGPRNMHIRMQKSLLKIGTTIVTHPQLGSTVMMTGGVLAFAVKSVALGWELKSGRYVISLEKQILSDHKTLRYRRQHAKHTKVIRRAIGSM